MKTNGNEPMTPCLYIKGDGSEINGVYNGLTKREHMAIEFTKAVLSNPCTIPNKEGYEYAVLVGIKTADELIKQLNQEEVV